MLPNYLLITPGWYVESWWRVDDEGLNCTVEDREAVVHSTIAPLNTFFLDETRDANLTTSFGLVRRTMHFEEGWD